MCGIVAIIGKGAEERGEDLDYMIQQMESRGEITEKYKEKSVLTGTRRLKIVDSFHAKQPIFNAEKTKLIIFNGEIFNYQELYDELKDQYNFETHSDTEVILAAYQVYGTGCLNHFNGQFSFVIIDLEQKECFMARDEIGIVPLYYVQTKDLIYIASEIKALTFLKHKIEKLNPGSFIYRKSQEQQYFIPKYKIQERNQELFLSELRTSLIKAVKSRVNTNLPIGVIFSGGLDSSIVLSQAIKFHRNVTAFTVGSENSDDVKIASRYCTEHNIKHVIINLSKNTFTPEDIKEAIVCSELTEYGDIINAVISMKLFQEISKHNIKIVLGGDGSDELFGGYDMYQRNNEKSVQKLFIHKLMNLHRTELQRVDRCSMAHGVEVRVPFLDGHLVHLALSIPKEWKIFNGIEKWCLREAFQQELPNYIIERRKNPLSHSSGLHEWIRMYKIIFKKFYAETSYNLHERLHKDFSTILRENNYHIEKSIQVSEKQEDYSPSHLVLEFAKALRHKIFH